MTAEPSLLSFPKGFLWGAATSAYQVEGAVSADGAGEGIWHRFSGQPGAIADGSTGAVACDHYHRVHDDLELMRWLGLGAYRFSLSWGRILPAGTGAVNARGLAFYDRLIDSLLEAGISPFVTLYHWDLPLALEDRGGWLNEDSAHWFGEFASVAFRAFADRVPHWVTHNEPAIVTEKGYLSGVYAPGHRNAAEVPIVARNLLRAHGVAVSAYRALGRDEIGIVVNLQPKSPASDDPADHAAARRADAFRNRQFLDAILLGQSPPELPAMFGPDWKELGASDWPLVRQPIDFVGVNYYTRNVIRHAGAAPLHAEVVTHPDLLHTLMGWEVYPAGLTEALQWVTDRFGRIPIYVTENGAAFADPQGGSGTIVSDPKRVEYLRTHLVAAHRALEAGVDLRGYFVWSLLDNFEWSSGYARPFGLVQVDFATQRRTLKQSADFFADVIRRNGVDALARPAGAEAPSFPHPGD